ncbi:hypothetical protein MNB_SUP05-SYMBIONT-5-143 [hydrothermal vent metagenome]|uniref:DUF91 domain-containing protein n=1 Tax=hydrothermal vent metagenome TaxID=652676 RepID=A0A1W1E6V8_9ZZZZ
MATHILTVTKKTFKIHLNYMFIGTGKNNSAHQSSALADILGIRNNDNIIFYVMNVGFFGIFKAIGNVFYEYDANHLQYLGGELGNKTLTYRMEIKFREVYEIPISEWNMMENPDNIKGNSILNMQWSWIFKKLNASRGCLAIDNHEFELFQNLLSDGNIKLTNVSNYDYVNKKIIELNNGLSYDNSKTNVEPKSSSIISKIRIEDDLRILFTAQAGLNPILDTVLDSEKNGAIDFIANEILCSFSERKMDLLFGTNEDKCLLIELKNKFIFNDSIYNQIMEYARWVSAYKKHYKDIVPILVLREARDVAPRKSCKYFKYLSKENQLNDEKSDWYQKVIDSLFTAKQDLKLKDICNLSELQVYTFGVDNEGRLLEFNKIA